MQIPLEVVGLGIDACIVWFFWHCYKSGTKNIEVIQNAKSFEANEDLVEVLRNSKDCTLPYACVEGVTDTISKPLKSRYVDGEEGLIQQIVTVEHRSKRMQGYWSDLMKYLRNSTDVVPFFIRSKDQGLKEHVRVHVQEPLSAEFLVDELKITYDHFEPTQANVLQKGIDRLFGDVTRGIQDRESMLGIGVPMLGFGRLVMDSNSNKITLQPPDSGYRYILTSSTLNEVIKKLTSKARIFKILAWVFGSIGIAGSLYILAKHFMEWRDKREHRRMLDNMRDMRQQMMDEAADEDDARNCVICLSNRREVVVLDCGHISMCLECSGALPSPRRCPICRQPVQRIIPTYMP